MHVALDIETECAVEGCADSQCKHALDFNRNRVIVVGLFGEGIKEVYRNLDALKSRLDGLDAPTLVGHNIIGFDLKTLAAKGCDLTDFWAEDTQLMATALTEKIPAQWLEDYEFKRKELNKTLPKGQSHREAGQHSLKTLAPYFLKIPRFWEETGDKDNDEYVLRDAEYTYRLYQDLVPRMQKDGTEKFYRDKLMPIAWMLARGEMRGVCLDLAKVEEKERIAQVKSEASKAKLDQMWSEAYEVYNSAQLTTLSVDYCTKANQAKARLKNPTPEKLVRCDEWYKTLCNKAKAKLESFNLNSPAQMSWLLKDHLKYDITDYEGNETTGIEVLERLAAEGKEDIRELIEYREAQKLCTSFFPSYREFAWKGKIHCNFSLSTARTGRTASQRPNLQQQPSHLRDIFVASPGYSFVVRDYAGIEPVLAAYYTQDPILCDLLIRGGNFHSANTPSFFPYVDCPEDQVKKRFPMERDAAKELGLLLAYGGGWRRIKISCMKRGFRFSDRECKARYEAFRERYQTLFEFKEETLDPMLREGATVTNLLGRKFKLPPDDVHMKGFNRMVQGSASDLLLWSSLRTKRALAAQGVKALPILWVHDEVVFEVEDAKLSQGIAVIDSTLTDYKLKSPYGNLPLHVEGPTGKCWTK